MRQLVDYLPVTELLLKATVAKWSFDSEPSLNKILEKETRVIVAVTHSAPLSWLPAVCLLASETSRSGGGGRRPLGIMDRLFYQIPGVRSIARFFTQTDHPLEFDELVDYFSRSEQTDLIVFPEGSNCFFGDPHNVQEFRSPRFLELAIRTKTPLLVAAHRGSEDWGKAVHFFEPLFRSFKYWPTYIGSKLETTGTFVIPLFPKRVPLLRMRCRIYKPTLRIKDLSVAAETRKQQIRDEGERVRQFMVEMLQELDSEEVIQ